MPYGEAEFNAQRRALNRSVGPHGTASGASHRYATCVCVSSAVRLWLSWSGGQTLLVGFRRGGRRDGGKHCDAARDDRQGLDHDHRADDGELLPAAGRAGLRHGRHWTPEQKGRHRPTIEEAGCRRSPTGRPYPRRLRPRRKRRAPRAIHGAKLAIHRDNAERVRRGDWSYGFKPQPDPFLLAFRVVGALVKPGPLTRSSQTSISREARASRPYGYDGEIVHLQGTREDRSACSRATATSCAAICS